MWRSRSPGVLLRGELRALDAEIRKALSLVPAEVSRRHLRGARGIAPPDEEDARVEDID